MTQFMNRHEAGKILAEWLKAYSNRRDVIVLGLPRGGVPVAYEVAKDLHAPLDVFIVRKLGVPNHEELAFGAMAPGGVTVFNDDIIHELHLSKKQMQPVIDAEAEELNRREIKYRGKRPFPPLENQHVILVDDGIATGATMRAAMTALRKYKPASIVIAVPVAAASTCESMEKLADKVVCPLKPMVFSAVGAWYEDFGQTTDEEVTELLKLHHPAA
jgi:putative phosphoribosyl transferase